MSPRHFSNKNQSRPGEAVRTRTALRRRNGRARARLSLGALSATGLAFIAVAAFGTQSALAAVPTIDLATASNYAVLAGQSVTNLGNTTIVGSIGVNPGTSYTGQSTVTQTGGTVNIANAAALQAQADSTAAYGVTASATPPTETITADLGGRNLVPGVYKSASSLGLTGQLTLTGPAGSQFIFQAVSTLTTASASSVVLTGGVTPCDVFWQVGSSATLGSTTNFNGTIMALTSVSLLNSATVHGRVLAQNGSVTLNANTINASQCAAVTPTTTTTAAGATTTTAAGGTTTTAAGGTTTTAAGGTTTTTRPGTTTTTRRSTTTVPVTTTSVSIIPVGAPATGFGGTAGSNSSPSGLIGFGAFAIAVAAGATALGARRRRLGAARRRTDGHPRGS